MGEWARSTQPVDPELDRNVAIKFLSPEIADTGPAVERLIREAKAASALNHPHIITVYEVIRTNDDVAIAMELVEGRALREFCGKPVEIAQVIHWGRQIAQALAAAHQRNIVHRDVKPENLMVRDDGILKVLTSGLRGLPTARIRRNRRALLRGWRNAQLHVSRADSRPSVRPARATCSRSGWCCMSWPRARTRFDAPRRRHSRRNCTAEPNPPSSLNRRIPAKFDTLVLRMLSKDPHKPALRSWRWISNCRLRPGQPGRRSVGYPVGGGDIAAWRSPVLRSTCSATSLVSAREPQFRQLTRQVNENRVTDAGLSPDGKSLLLRHSVVLYTGAV